MEIELKSLNMITVSVLFTPAMQADSLETEEQRIFAGAE